MPINKYLRKFMVLSSRKDDISLHRIIHPSCNVSLGVCRSGALTTFTGEQTSNVNSISSQ